jgi:hypothetical protein
MHGSPLLPAAIKLAISLAKLTAPFKLNEMMNAQSGDNYGEQHDVSTDDYGFFLP